MKCIRSEWVGLGSKEVPTRNEMIEHANCSLSKRYSAKLHRLVEILLQSSQQSTLALPADDMTSAFYNFAPQMILAFLA